MSESVICLSDSDHSDEPECSSNICAQLMNLQDNGMDLNFPAVQFDYCMSNRRKINIKSNSPESKSTISKEATDLTNVLDQNGSGSRFNDLLAKYTTTEPMKDLPEKSQGFLNNPFALDTDDDEEADVSPPTSLLKKVRKKLPRKDSELPDNNKERRKLEKERKAQQVAEEKAEKALEKKKMKNIQPGECLKFMQVNIDYAMENCDFIALLFEQLRGYQISWKIESLHVPNTITWTRTKEEYYINENNTIGTKTEKIVEKQMIIVWTWNEAVKKIKDGSFTVEIENIAVIMFDKQLTLVIYGMGTYFDYHKKSREHRERINDSRLKDSPKISKNDLEMCLTNIQLSAKCNSSLVETPEEASMLIYRYTKSIAEIPFKLKKNEIFAGKINSHAMADKRDTVKVDKDSNGLARLWKQQICQFKLVNLEVAEAITALYDSPHELMTVSSVFFLCFIISC